MLVSCFSSLIIHALFIHVFDLIFIENQVSIQVLCPCNYLQLLTSTFINLIPKMKNEYEKSRLNTTPVFIL